MADNNYQAMTAKEIVGLDNQKKISKDKKAKLEKLLTEFEDLFQ